MAISSTASRDDFGFLLRTERERRGLTLDQLSAATKVGRKHLEALEHGDYQALPNGIFRRGIVRAYLKVAGLQEETWMPLFVASLTRHSHALGAIDNDESDAWEEFASNVQRSRPKRVETASWRWLGVIALFVVVAAGAVALWYFQLRPLPLR